MATKESMFLKKWKKDVSQILKMTYPEISKDKLNQLLEEQICLKLENPEVFIINNYQDKQVRTNVLTMIDFIYEKNLIIGAGGCLFIPHNARKNYMIGYIRSKQRMRSFYKNERKKYEEGTDEWKAEDTKQNNTKTGINTLYGVQGYARFFLYNRFLAEAITNCGRQIITTAVMTFENFLSGSVKYNTSDEIFLMIRRINKEYHAIKNFDFTPFDFGGLRDKLYQKIIDSCEFELTDTFEKTLATILDNMDREEQILLYYKNNLFEFIKVPKIHQALHFVMNNLYNLSVPEIEKIEDDDLRDTTEQLWFLIDLFVVYNYPIYDRVRKAMYTDRESVLYVDTDSNFLAFDPWVQYIFNHVMDGKSIKEFGWLCTSINVLGIFLSRVISKSLLEMCRNMNIPDEYGETLQMKNEFVLSLIAFADVKKRYIANAIYQEGKLLNNGIGIAEIKGYDFKKASTKPYVRDYMTQICLDDILRCDEINIELIFFKLMKLKEDIYTSIHNGESMYYKQTTVQVMEHYKKPYSNQGFKSLLIWNALCPQYQLEFPADIDIVPIREINCKRNKKGGLVGQKFFDWFEEKYPEAYMNLETDILKNANPDISQASYKFMAKPSNTNIELPEWFYELVDTDAIIQSNMKLFHSIAESIGMKLPKTSSGVKHITNIVEL